jgi:serine/threonine protein phosphatase PrpC
MAAGETAALRDRGTAGNAAFRADGGDSDWCALRAASVAGVRHRLSARPGQDSFAWALLPDRLVVAVADGLGGVPGSDCTASRAVAAAVEAAAAAAESPGARLAAGVAAANQAAAEGGATTLVLAVMDRGGDLSLARVGDSTAFLISDAGKSWRELFTPPEEDTLVTATAALPADEVEPELVTLTTANDDLLLLATDGVGDPWRDGPATVAPALAAAVSARPDPLELTQLADFSRQGCHDDRTMLVVWRYPSAG